MPPKRKATAIHRGHPTEPPPSRASSPQPDNATDSTTKDRVRWALPTTSRENQDRKEADAIGFAPFIYQRPWSQLETEQPPFGFSRIRTPIFRGPGSNMTEGDRTNPNSAPLVDFFNAIKENTLPSKNLDPRGPYTSDAIHQAFHNAGDDVAVVLSRSTSDPILQLDQDYSVQITLSHDGELREIVEMNFLRRTAAASEDSRPAAPRTEYFIELLPGTRVTVNGTTYINDATSDDLDYEDGETNTSGSASPFCIGPLHPYTVVELLSQPMFFFRERSELNSTKKVTGKKHEPSNEELANRDTRGVAKDLEVEIVWTPLVNSSPPAPGPQSQDTPVAPRANDNTDNSAAITEQSPCARLQASLQRLREEIGPESDARPLEPQEVFRSIAAVARAVNRQHGSNDQIAVIGQQTIEDTDTSSLLISSTYTLIPWLSRSHMMLVVICKMQSTGDNFQFHVVDSAPWTHNSIVRADTHQRLRGIVRRNATADDNQIPTHTQWAFGSLQSDLWHAPYFTVLNAWSAIFGMRLDPDFRSTNNFFTEAYLVIQAALTGSADWRLIWSFLKCHGFATSEEPGQQMRFEQTLPTPIGTEHNEKPQHSSELADSLNNTVFQALKRLRHCDDFPWDDWNERDADIRLPAIHRSGLESNTFSCEKLRAVYDAIKDLDVQASSEDFPPNFKPCLYLREQLNKLLNQDRTKELLKTLMEAGVTTETKLWLHEFDVSPAIASVTQAVTAAQDMTGGFCTITQEHVQRAEVCAFPGENWIDIENAVRFGRPIVVPLIQESHIVLLVIQHDEKDVVRISIHDSRGHNFRYQGRDWIYDIARGLVRYSNWWRHSYDTFEDVQIARHAEWVPCAQQSCSAECGYHTIMNAWALALGLVPNVNFNPVWYTQDKDGRDVNGPFLTDLQSVIQLVRVGLADWKLIYAFLRCNRFVHEGVVPPARRFTRTVPLMDDNALRAHLASVRMDEEQHWNNHRLSTEDLRTIRRANRVPLIPGRAHNDPTRFPSDTWNDSSDKVIADDLAQDGHARLDLIAQRFRAYSNRRRQPSVAQAREHVIRRGAVFLDQLAGQGLDLARMSRDQIISQYADFTIAPGTDAFFASQIQKFPHALSEELSSFAYSLTTKLAAHAFTDVQFAPRADIDNPSLIDAQVVHAINAVVQAIDQHQLDAHQRTFGGEHMFRGGFALATFDNIVNSRDFDSPTVGDATIRTSRPRRCWLIPMTVSNSEIWKYRREYEGKHERPPSELKAHSFLSVIQEETTSKDIDGKKTRFSHFHIYTLDSSRTVLKSDRNTIFQMAINTAYNLNWATHRNDRIHPGHSDPKLDNPEFTPELRDVAVSKQEAPWACGHHTILNAWILALGLTPDPKHKFTTVDYEMIWKFSRAAVAGMLNWKDLVAWLFHRKAVMEQNIDDVGEDRRFGLSVCQAPSGAQLEQYLEEVHDSDGERALTSRSVADIAYSLDNNVDWTLATVTPQKVGSPVVPRRVIPTPGGSEDTDANTTKTNSGEATSGQDSGEVSRGREEMSLADAEAIAALLAEDEDQGDIDAEGDSDDATTAVAYRRFEKPGMPGKSSSKRKNPKSLKRSHDDLDRGFPRKKIKFHLGSDLVFLEDVDVDGDVKMMESPWRKTKEDLSFLEAY